MKSRGELKISERENEENKKERGKKKGRRK
jgi:hypothetical protein